MSDQRLFQTSLLTASANLGLVPTGVKQSTNKQAPGGAKVANLEAILTDELKDQKSTIGNPQSTQNPTQHSRRLQSSLLFQDDSMFENTIINWVIIQTSPSRWKVFLTMH